MLSSPGHCWVVLTSTFQVVLQDELMVWLKLPEGDYINFLL